MDEYSRYIEIDVMKKKSDTFECFQAWLLRAMPRHNCGLTVLVSDNGGEYMSKRFQNLLKMYGVKHQTTVPNHPQQNGKSERLNQTLLTMIHCIKLEENIPCNLWDHLLQVAIFVLNVRPTRMLPDGEVPWTRWKKTEPPVNRLRVISSQAFYTVEATSKFDVQGREGIM
eukprot:Ihof_evm4s492 gene=Ihof_evmTU4s492